MTPDTVADNQFSERDTVRTALTRHVPVNVAVGIIAVFWTLFIAASLGWNLRHNHRTTIARATVTARSGFQKDLLFRLWATAHGGVYVPVTAQTPPSPYLAHIPERDITTPSGRILTLINPAYMTRQVHELGKERFGVRGHITSLKTLRSENAPDNWERKALEAFARGETEEATLVEQIEGLPYFRFMRPMITKNGCLKCHATQGYKVGDIRGGISLDVPLAPYVAIDREYNRNQLIGYVTIWALGLAGLATGTWLVRRRRCERDRAVAELVQSEAKFRTLVDFTYDWEYWVALDGRMLYVSPSCERVTGYRANEFINDSNLQHRIIHPEDRARFSDHHKGLNTKRSHSLEFRIITRAGEVRWIGHVCQPVFDADGEWTGRRGSNRDITERKQAVAELLRHREKLEERVQDRTRKLEDARQAALSMMQDANEQRKSAEEALNKLAESTESLRLLSQAIENSTTTVIITDAKGTIEYLNPAFEQTTGYFGGEALGQNPRILKSGQQNDAFYHDMWQTLSSGTTWNGCFVNKRKDGSLYTEEATISPVLNAAGDIVNYVAVKRDITGQLDLESQLRQAQKMEAVGRLAGGVAHDFNNKLQVILSYAEMSLRSVDPASNMHGDLNEISKAAKQSADLTRQLLTFARKQTISPKILDLNASIENMLKMLRRLIGENTDLLWNPAGDLWPVKMDPTQIDQILANLCINARDAINGSGSITIKTQNTALDDPYCTGSADAPPGDYLMLSISDNGCGMEKELLSHIYEPFFTSKALDQGTGLGLATVYGIVKQNSGIITVDSAPSKGTTFKIYLPRCLDETAPLPEDTTKKPPMQGRETILLVEDSPTVLNLVLRLLETLGYTVLTADLPSTAIRIAKEYSGKIDALVTDVIMPEANGPELAAQLKSLRPNLKCLFMSGYTADTMGSDNFLPESVNFIQKPFKLEDIATKLRTVLVDD